MERSRAPPASEKWIRDVLAQTLRDVSALAPLIRVDCRLDRSFRLKTGRRVFGLGVVIAPIAQFVGIALEMRMHVTRHQFVAPLRRRPVRPVVCRSEAAGICADGG